VTNTTKQTISSCITDELIDLSRQNSEEEKKKKTFIEESIAMSKSTIHHSKLINLDSKREMKRKITIPILR